MPELDPSVEAPKLQDTSDLLQSVWPEDFERLNRLRREFAEAEDWDNRPAYQPPRGADPPFKSSPASPMQPLLVGQKGGDEYQHLGPGD